MPIIRAYLCIFKGYFTDEWNAKISCPSIKLVKIQQTAKIWNICNSILKCNIVFYTKENFMSATHILPPESGLPLYETAEKLRYPHLFVVLEIHRYKSSDNLAFIKMTKWPAFITMRC